MEKLDSDWTAKEIFWSIADNPKADIDILRIKAYGKRCAKQALIDAAENAEGEMDYSNPYDPNSGYPSVDKKSILNTEIKTP